MYRIFIPIATRAVQRQYFAIKKGHENMEIHTHMVHKLRRDECSTTKRSMTIATRVYVLKLFLIKFIDSHLFHSTCMYTWCRSLRLYLAYKSLHCHTKLYIFSSIVDMFNSLDPSETPTYMVFHSDLKCWPKLLLGLRQRTGKHGCTFNYDTTWVAK